MLAPSPDILLLDEPTNHLDLPAIEWLERELDARQAALVLISHDRRFLTNLSRITVWLDRGKARRIERGFAEFEAWRDDVLAEEERDRHKLDRKIEAEEHWMRYGVTRTAQAQRTPRRRPAGAAPEPARGPARGRHGRDVGRRGGTLGSAGDRGEGHLEKLRRDADRDRFLHPHRARRPDRHRRPQWQRQDDAGRIFSPARSRPTAGTVRLGANLQMATLDQHRESLNPDWTVSEALTGGRGDTVMIGGQAKHVVGYMRDFLFAPEQARTPLRVLSGGERGRLMLARALAKPSNVLVLDEPTNDLDLETLDVLEEMIGDYAGTVLLISHDRDFLDRVVDDVIVPEGNGKWLEYAGGYTDMLAQRGDDLRKTRRQANMRRTGRAG